MIVTINLFLNSKLFCVFFIYLDVTYSFISTRITLQLNLKNDKSMGQL